MQELILLEYDREIRRMLQKDGAGRSQKALNDLGFCRLEVGNPCKSSTFGFCAAPASR